MELEEAIKYLKDIKEKDEKYLEEYDIKDKDMFRNDIEAISTVLQALYNSIPKEKLEKKEKVINEMAKLISNTYCDDPDSICLDLDEEYPTVENIKQYFEKKVEE